MAVVPSESDLFLPEKKRKIVEEDTYVEKLEKIIQRDFFPDIAKLRAQGEYLDAVERNDVEKIRELQMKYSRRRTDLVSRIRTPRQDASPETFETPDIRPTRDFVYDSEKAATTDGSLSQVKEKDDLEGVGLDKFLLNYTSEDNASFGEIMDITELKRRQRLAWMYNAERNHNAKHALTYNLPSNAVGSTGNQLALTSGSDQDGASVSSLALCPQTDEDVSHTAIAPGQPQAKAQKRPAVLDGWSYKAMNAVMWPPEEVELTTEEKVKRKLMLEREIVHGNTRFKEKQFSERAAEETMNRALGVHAAINKGRVDIQGHEIGGFNRPGTQFGYVVTPSPMPGVNESPMMTWGEIEGTPFRLDASDLPVLPGIGTGPSFKIPDVPMRDSLALGLVEEASKRYRQRKEKAVFEVTHNFASPSLKFGSAKSIERLNEMSPAARRLATSKLGIRLSTDRALKASYTPSPLRRTGEKTPILVTTPKELKTPDSMRTPGSKRLAVPSQSLTDNLLKISAAAPTAAKATGEQPKRLKAKDFFD